MTVLSKYHKQATHGGEKFQLVEMVMRWSSEHHLAGLSFPLELQLIHYDTHRYKSLQEALKHPNGVIIVAKFFQVSYSSSCEFGCLFFSFNALKVMVAVFVV